MEAKLSIDASAILNSSKVLGSESFARVWWAAAYYVKYHGRLPKDFNEKMHKESYEYFCSNILPLLNGRNPENVTVINDKQKDELIDMINDTQLFDDDEKKVLLDMLTFWWGRGKYSRTELVYTQSMCQTRTGVGTEKFVELRMFLKAEECLKWENRPYGDYLTSYHTFNEARLYQLLKEYNNEHRG